MTLILADRRRSMGSLFTGVAAMNTAMAAVSPAATLLAAKAIGPQWSGLPGAAAVLGTAAGTLGAGALIARRGNRSALMTMYGLALCGALIAFAAAAGTVVLLLMAGMMVLGLGNGAAQLSRYVAAELYPLERKATALSTVVWAGTVGAIVGPTLIAPGAEFARWLRLHELAGPVMIAVVMTGCALLAGTTLPRLAAPVAPRLSLGMVRSAIRRPEVLAPLVAMIGAQVAMVAVMTMTPLQLDHHGHGLGTVGLILSAHMIGMFALAPLSGVIADRWGGRATIYLGMGTLVLAATTAVAAPTAHQTGLPVALFLLGYGWNLVFVGGSSMLTRGLAPSERSQIQGAVDALVWCASGFASVFAGTLFGLGGYSLVAVVAGVLALAPLAVLSRAS
jgi:MFS family permease